MMGDTPNGIPKLLSEAIEDERLYHTRFRGDSHGGRFRASADELEELVREEAERIEKTVGCVTEVVRCESNRLGPSVYESIYLFAILPRHVDTDLFHRVIEESNHRVRMKAAEGDK